MSDIDRHFDRVVSPAARAFQIADSFLCKVSVKSATGDLETATIEAERLGRIAAQALFHLNDHVFRAQPAWLPPKCDNVHKVRSWFNSTFVQNPSDDADIVEAVANAAKHGVATKSGLADDGTFARPRNYGTLAFGEGWYGGGHTVIVNWKGGHRALVSTLARTYEAWETALGRQPGTLRDAIYEAKRGTAI